MICYYLYKMAPMSYNVCLFSQRPFSAPSSQQLIIITFLSFVKDLYWFEIPALGKEWTLRPGMFLSIFIRCSGYTKVGRLFCSQGPHPIYDSSLLARTTAGSVPKERFLATRIFFGVFVQFCLMFKN